MFCPSCGKQFSSEYNVCPHCGKIVEQAAPQPEVQKNQQYAPPQAQYAPPQGQYTPPPYPQGQYVNTPQSGAYPGVAQPNFNVGQNANMPPKSVSFGDAIKLFFKNYANFTGRATTSEYWFAFLFNFIIGFVLGCIPVVGWILSVPYSLAVFIPGLSIAVRRMHDTGKSWAYLLMGLIPIAGLIILLVQFCKDSDGDNKWGPARRN